MKSKYILKFSIAYKNKLKKDFFNSNFSFDCNSLKWKKVLRLSTYNESSNLFYISNETNKLFIAKSYEFLDYDQINLLKRLDNTNFTEEYVDDILIFLDHEKRLSAHIVIFNLIEFSSSDIPLVYKDKNIAMKMIFNCLNFIHDKNILHNDIKPDNIMFDGKNIKLIDFEFAVDFKTKKFNNLEVLSMYKHPKMWRNKNYFSVKKDFWAAICSIYFIYNNFDLFDELRDDFIKNKNEKNNYFIIKNFIFSNNNISNYYNDLLKEYF